MFLYIILIVLLGLIGWMIINRFSGPVEENKQMITISKSNPLDPVYYTEGDYGKYPFILYEKRKREQRLYDSLTYDFYHINK
ncbi:hypothetical protein Klosneuvirus_1_358 [Klosneuvirus KNV1]|uniref:Uncharacterized protein n=1 Tax=Klosneuvirus KNV1 TaxID=1977640 RepID=A0A1V0SIL4_9VIRU|nr:hypothetical protein Klosneuvirus_1_358 [Klosneuvirus KNV1]